MRCLFVDGFLNWQDLALKKSTRTKLTHWVTIADQ